MAIEYLGLNSVNGPFVVLEGVKGAAYDEIVEIVADGKEKKLGRIVEINEDKAVVQVFEGTDNLSLKNTNTRLTGHPMEIGLTDQLLGRTFNGFPFTSAYFSAATSPRLSIGAPIPLKVLPRS